MAKKKVSVVVGCVALWSVMGCGDPGVTSVTPIPAGAGGTAPRAGTAGTSSPAPTGMAMTPVMMQPTTAGMAGASPVVAAGTGAPAAAAGTGAASSTAGTMAAATAGTMAAATAGTGAAGTGATAGAMAAAGASGTGAAGAAEPPGSCPSGWMCMDVGALMLDAKDQNGNEITTTCGNGELAECNDADPASSCPMLKNPFCAHLEFAGTPVVSCGAACTP